jgi:hypothetical protein
MSLAPGTAKRYNAVQRLKTVLAKLDDFRSRRIFPMEH